MPPPTIATSTWAGCVRRRSWWRGSRRGNRGLSFHAFSGGKNKGMPKGVPIWPIVAPSRLAKVDCFVAHGLSSSTAIRTSTDMTPDQARLQRRPSGRRRMEGTTTERMAVDAFQMRQTDIGAVDVAQLHALSMAVGWPHRADDWHFLRTAGHGIAALDDIGRVLGSAMWFPHGSAFATVGMVITSPRLQALGTGQWLMKSV